MSHHLSGPNLRPPAQDARLDLTDVFAFQSLMDPANTVLIMDVNSFGFDPARGPQLHPEAVYRLNVDTDGDDRADVAFSFVFSPPRNGEQSVTVYHAVGEDARRHEVTGSPVIVDAPVSFGPDPIIVQQDWLAFSAGLRSDPFFADLEGIGNDFHWTGRDALADKDVIGIVLEVPARMLGDGGPIGVWGQVSVVRDGELTTVDRGAHPSLTAYFNPEDGKDEYNRREPADDRANYLAAWVKVLEHTGGYTPQAAEEALRTVLPDILRFDRSRPAAYPNGRTLKDDITSVRLRMISNGKITGDGIDPHTDLLPHFPYLGNPHSG
ncbi:DUF4331 family protein [Rhizohabitans arisaemae]|uniref:DUF4331 family protein n=1 Tax=Rhizohabitans arisaemae TaxID=2720610 RepID=UPI0024B2820B|nr:DUF4331 family protein [Rhizohabitans arisaemae]